MDAEAWDERYAASELIWSAGPNQFVEAACADLPPGRAADLAAGEGRNALWLASLGWQVTAVDFSQVALDKGARIEAGRIEHGTITAHPAVVWQCADATTWHGAGLDLVLIAYLHLPADERAAAVRNAMAALVVGGTFVLVAHDASNLVHGTGGPQDPALLPTPAEVLRDVTGFEVTVIRAEVVDRIVGDSASHQHAGVGGLAKDTLVHLVKTGPRDG